LSTSAATMDHLLDALSALDLSSRKMFGEFALYLGGKVVALVCDDRLFIKPTAGLLDIMPGGPFAPPYPGAKPYLDASEMLDEPDRVIALLRQVASELPMPKPKTPKSVRKKKGT
jgi:TfoX/Sxy family transcriptional regulator of competence genes